MRYAGSVGKGNVNLLYTDFRTVDDYDRETQKRLGINMTPVSLKTAKAKKEMIMKDISQLSQPNDEFENLSLKEQIEVVMRPVLNPDLKPEILQQHLYDLESSRLSSKDLGRLTADGYTPEVNSKAIIEADVSQELNSYPITGRAGHSSKYSVSLPPIKEGDPFACNQVIKHWHYHKPVKHNSVNAKHGSISALGTSDSSRRYPGDSKSPVDQNKSLFNNIKNRSPPLTLRTLGDQPSKTQRYINVHVSPSSGSLKNPGLATMQPLPTKESPTSQFNEFNMQVAANQETASLLEQLNDPKIISTEGIIPSKRVNYLQDASNEATHLLTHGPVKGNLNSFDRDLLEKNQARSQQKLTDSDKRSLNFIGEEDRVVMSSPLSMMSSKREMTTKEKKEIHFPVIMDRRISKSPTKKKEFYNKWYVPVKYWNVSKHNNHLEKKYEELKKDSNYYYHNLHNYSGQNNLNPLKDGETKSEQQLNFEAMQERLKQNVTIRKYKKQLAENHQRIPSFLKSIEENEKK